MFIRYTIFIILDFYLQNSKVVMQHRYFYYYRMNGHKNKQNGDTGVSKRAENNKPKCKEITLKQNSQNRIKMQNQSNNQMHQCHNNNPITLNQIQNSMISPLSFTELLQNTLRSHMTQNELKTSNKKQRQISRGTNAVTSFSSLSVTSRVQGNSIRRMIQNSQNRGVISNSQMQHSGSLSKSISSQQSKKSIKLININRLPITKTPKIKKDQLQQHKANYFLNQNKENQKDIKLECSEKIQKFNENLKFLPRDSALPSCCLDLNAFQSTACINLQNPAQKQDKKQKQLQIQSFFKQQQKGTFDNIFALKKRNQQLRRHYQQRICQLQSKTYNLPSSDQESLNTPSVQFLLAFKQAVQTQINLLIGRLSEAKTDIIRELDSQIQQIKQQQFSQINWIALNSFLQQKHQMQTRIAKNNLLLERLQDCQKNLHSIKDGINMQDEKEATINLQIQEISQCIEKQQRIWTGRKQNKRYAYIVDQLMELTSLRINRLRKLLIGLHQNEF